MIRDDTQEQPTEDMMVIVEKRERGKIEMARAEEAMEMIIRRLFWGKVKGDVGVGDLARALGVLKLVQCARRRGGWSTSQAAATLCFLFNLRFEYSNLDSDKRKAHNLALEGA